MFASLSGVTTNKQRGLFLFTLRVTSRLAHLFTIIWIADFPLILPTFRRHASRASTLNFSWGGGGGMNDRGKGNEKEN